MFNEQDALYSIDAEQAVIGGLIHDISALENIEDIVQIDDFYHKNHRLIFLVILTMHHHKQPVDLLTVEEALSNNGQLENIGGRHYLVELATVHFRKANIAAYAQIVHEKSTLRQLLTLSNHLRKDCFNTEGRTTTQILDQAEKIFTEISGKSSDSQHSIKSMTELLPNALERLHELHQSKDGIIGYPTKWEKFDSLLSGLNPGDMTVIAGRPSMGKTTFALNLVERIATHAELPCLIFSLEMPEEQLIFKLMASLGGIDLTKLKRGDLNDFELKSFSDASLQLNKLPIYIDARSNLSSSELRSVARQFKRKHGKIGAIMIDYLQLMSIPGRSDQRVAEVSELSRSMKSLARELNVPVIVLSQLNRNLEQRSNKRPIMSDIRESGAIEQDADNILFIYRDEVYNEYSEEKGISEIIVGKQRNGPIGTFKLAFQGHCSRFMNLSNDIFELY